MAAILKADGSTSRPASPQAVAFNFADMTSKAQDYLGDVRAEAAKIIAQAQQQANQIREQAKIDGRKDALVQAEQSMQAKVAQQLQFLVPAVQEAVVEVQRERKAWVARWEQNAIALAAAIAERVVRREIAAAPQITLDLVREALHLASGMGTLQIRLNPQDYATLEPNLKTLVEQMKQLAPTEIIADAAIAPGGCRVDTQYGSIDQQIHVQLERIRQELAGSP
jgi:flagellar assembly protein FliH